MLSARTTAVHATHLTDTDVAILGGSRTTAGFCPTTEADLADGIGPARRLFEAGSPLALGSDQHAVIDPFAELRGLELHERLASGERGRFTPGGADHDRQRVGLSQPRLGGRPDRARRARRLRRRTGRLGTHAGARPDQICYAATAADVEQVVVGGRTIVKDGCHHLGSPARLLAAALDRLGER